MSKNKSYNIWGEGKRTAAQRTRDASVRLVKVISSVDGSFKEQLWVEGNCVLESTSGPLTALHALECLTTEVYGSSGAFDFGTTISVERFD
jgi:hypothetical protein